MPPEGDRSLREKALVKNIEFGVAAGLVTKRPSPLSPGAHFYWESRRFSATRMDRVLNGVAGLEKEMCLRHTAVAGPG